MNEETTVLWRQTENIRGYLWHRYSVEVNQVMVAAITYEVTTSINH
jgi:hypothetical protein